jgi:hypothetical protein
LKSKAFGQASLRPGVENSPSNSKKLKIFIMLDERHEPVTSECCADAGKVVRSLEHGAPGEGLPLGQGSGVLLADLDTGQRSPHGVVQR